MQRSRIFDLDLSPLIPPERGYLPGPDVVAVRRSLDGAVVQEIFERAGRTFGFRYAAWVNFADAGGNPHHGWGEFHPDAELVTDSLKEAQDLALVHAHDCAITFELEPGTSDPERGTAREP